MKSCVLYRVPMAAGRFSHTPMTTVQLASRAAAHRASVAGLGISTEFFTSSRAMRWLSFSVAGRK
jgi:hypothetical protein